MQDVLILPTYDRPELLWVCLEHLAANPEVKDLQIRIVVDAHIGQRLHTPKADIAEVVEKFPHLSIQVGYRTPHQFPGNSFNVLMAYKETYDTTDAPYVYLVEDDIMVHPLFFAWHQMQHQNPEVACSIAVVKEHFHGPYASWGVCFKRGTLPLVLPHCKTAYFQNQRHYCQQYFPPAKWHCEQDGLWCRVLVGQHIVWAATPMAQHVGWYGYHRLKGVRPYGTLDERYRQVKQALSSVEALASVVRDKFQDVRPPAFDSCN